MHFSFQYLVLQWFSSMRDFYGTRKYIAEDREDHNWTEHVFGFYFRMAVVLAIVGALIYATVS